MKINIHVDNQIKTVELFQVTYETQPDRFKSLRISKGTYPSNALLDYKDASAVIEKDFVVDEASFDEALSLLSNDLFIDFNDTLVLKNNWFCFEKGTLKSEIDTFFQMIGRTYR